MQCIMHAFCSLHQHNRHAHSFFSCPSSLKHADIGTPPFLLICFHRLITFAPFPFFLHLRSFSFTSKHVRGHVGKWANDDAPFLRPCHWRNACSTFSPQCVVEIPAAYLKQDFRDFRFNYEWWEQFICNLLEENQNFAYDSSNIT